MSDALSTGGSSSSVTYAFTSRGMKIEGDSGPQPASIPDGLLLTRAVQTKAGWVGQIIIDKQIAWETEPFADAKDALACVNGRIVKRLRKTFG